MQFSNFSKVQYILIVLFFIFLSAIFLVLRSWSNGVCKNEETAKAYISGFDERISVALEQKIITEKQYIDIDLLMRSGKTKSYTEVRKDWRGLCYWFHEIADEYGM